MLNNKKGITLIALVVTVVVLIILAGVSINAVLGDNGIIKKANQAASVTKEAEVKEMWLTHYSPSLTKPEEYMDDVKAIFPNSIAAKDKRSVELVFED